MRNTDINPLIQTLKTLDADQFTPFHFNVDDHHTLKIESIFRILPNKRLTALVHFQNEYYVAKLFFSKNHETHAKQNKTSYALLERYHIETPKLLQESSTACGRVSILIYEYIAAPTLEFVLACESDQARLLVYFTQAVHELATQHVYGLVQDDAHFNNYLVADDQNADLPFQKKIICLDSSSFLLLQAPLDLKTSFSHLALFLSQLGTHYPKLQQHLFHHYIKARSATCSPTQEKIFWCELSKALQKRRLHFSKKLLRNSTAYRAFSENSWQGMILKSWGAQLAQVIAHFSSQYQLVFDIIKAGRSATVMEAKIDDREIILKQYHIKNRWHALRRWLRPSRAQHQWLITKQCELARIPVIKTLGFMEKKKWGFQQNAILVYEKVKGTPAPIVFQQLKTQEEKSEFFKKIAQYLKSIYDFQLVHGDLKFTNFMITDNQEPILLDWDGARFYSISFLLKRAIQKDVNRFLKNFEHETDFNLAREIIAREIEHRGNLKPPITLSL